MYNKASILPVTFSASSKKSDMILDFSCLPSHFKEFTVQKDVSIPNNNRNCISIHNTYNLKVHKLFIPEIYSSGKVLSKVENISMLNDN